MMAGEFASGYAHFLIEQVSIICSILSGIRKFLSGGLTESELIKTAVIDFYFPFLPLQESHVIECIKDEFVSLCKHPATDEQVKEVLQYIGFQQNTKFAHTGCKTIHPKVKAECRH